MKKEVKDNIRSMLNSYLIYKNDIKNIELEIKEIKNNYEISSIEYKERTGQTYKVNKDVENRVINKDSKIKHLTLLKENNRIKCEKIENAVNTLKEFERSVIEAKYMKSPVAWDVVANKLGFSKIACKRAEERAIIKMSPLLLK